MIPEYWTSFHEQADSEGWSDAERRGIAKEISFIKQRMREEEKNN